VEEELVSCVEIFDGDAHYAVEMLIDFVDVRFELLPESLLLFSRARRRVRCLRIRRLGEA
jgi:hypothetical protein